MGGIAYNHVEGHIDVIKKIYTGPYLDLYDSLCLLCFQSVTFISGPAYLIHMHIAVL